MLQPEERALVYKLGLALERIKRNNASWEIIDFANELERIANNQRRFIGFGSLERAFDPDKYPGRVIIATMHKAKGLEWDRVYLSAVNQYNFPSLEENDVFIAERWYLRDNLNLQAETLAQLDSLLKEPGTGPPPEGEATLEARVDYAAERLRLFYVGITRAKRELVATWNIGRRDDLEAALPLRMLMEYWGQKDD
jgi:DNA helicase-2/ATP-dependent DNA helicase PcrA